MTTIEINQEELEVILSALPAAWTEAGQHPKMVALKAKLRKAVKA